MPHAPSGFAFRKGSIAKIEMWNFVTYSHAAIYPNSALNLIVGPNGSGKSSIVCAICLGFGGNPKLLERGEKAKDYVQHNKTEATIEISLATGVENEVTTIRRKITTDAERSEKSESNSASDHILRVICYPPPPLPRGWTADPLPAAAAWFIDGVSKKLKDVDALVKAYNIQLANYTQFLPQDVVKMFPALTSRQLLVRTEEALGDNTLKTQHDRLIELKDGGKDQENRWKMEAEALRDLRAEQEKNKREVEKFKEWKTILERVESMKRKQPWLEFDIQKDKYEELNQLRKDSKKVRAACCPCANARAGRGRG